MVARWLIVMVIAMVVAVFGAAGGTPEALKAGFIYVGPVKGSVVLELFLPS